jgi:hypothetical protein
VIVEGTKAIFWMMTVFSEDPDVVAGTGVPATTAAEVSTAVTVVPGTGVWAAGEAWDGNGGKIWLHPLTIRNATATAQRITMYFITKILLPDHS